MSSVLSRRNLLFGLGASLAAPAVIRTAGLLMPVRAIQKSTVGFGLVPVKLEGGVLWVDSGGPGPWRIVNIETEPTSERCWHTYIGKCEDVTDEWVYA